MKKLAYIIFLSFSTCLFSYSNDYIANAIKDISKESQLDERVYYTLIEIESNFKPLIIGMIVDNSTLGLLELDSNFSVKTAKYKNNKMLVAITSNSEKEIIGLAKKLYKQSFNIDLGLMQISKQHIQEEELDKIFDPKYNIAKGSNILHSCFKRFKATNKVIECYNKGYRVNTATYFNKYKQSYLSNFEGQR